MLIEAFSQGKKFGQPEANEDSFVAIPGAGFAVIDGVTDRNGTRYAGMLSGQFASRIVKRATETLGAPIYVRHEVVHNKFVVDDLKARGAIFVEELDEVPDGNTVIFSAHGVSQAVRNEAARRGLKVFDATCPLVTKVHLEVARQCRNGRDMVLVDVHLEIQADLTVEQGHAIASEARRRAMARDDVLNVMTHVDPVRVPRTDAPARASA